MKKALTGNLTIGVILIVLLWINYDETQELRTDYDSYHEELELLVQEYNDSTTSDRKYFGSSELVNYANNFDNDSLINFVIRQGHQRQYFSGYHNELNMKLDVLNGKLNNLNNTIYVLVVMTIVSFVFTATLLFKHGRSK